MPNIDNIKKYKNIHMIGIGGVSMSGIAAILSNWGFHITGSDMVDSEVLAKLQQLGIKVTVGTNLEDVASADVVVYYSLLQRYNMYFRYTWKNNNYIYDFFMFYRSIKRSKYSSWCIFKTN